MNSRLKPFVAVAIGIAAISLVLFFALRHRHHGAAKAARGKKNPHHHGGVYSKDDLRKQRQAARALAKEIASRPGIAACKNGQRDAEETDVDCGGICGACDDGRACREGADCRSGGCNQGACVAWAKSVATGANFSCALTTFGTVKCWGSNDSGQLGDGTYRERPSPVEVTGITGAKSVAVGGIPLHDFGWACAVGDTGVMCWGKNDKGSLGVATPSESTRPIAVASLGSDVTAIALGYSHGCALTSGGGLKCWGENGKGQLGDGTTETRRLPIDVLGLDHGVAAVAAAGMQTCILTTAGGVQCWGDNEYGQLGDGTKKAHSKPAGVEGLGSGVASISAGHHHSCAVLTSGKVMCWGRDQYGQIGNGVEKPRVTKPFEVQGLPPMALVSAGYMATCGVSRAGAVICWGHGGDRELGDGSRDDNPERRVVHTLESGVAPSLWMGKWHGCAVTVVGGVKCWGWNARGALGTGDTTQATSGPVDVFLPTH
jgi:alpha-tubulin suppressor-like RCC1 family protein